MATLTTVGWVAFAGQHMVMSHPPIRKRLIDYFGSEERFRSVYSIASFAVFVPLCVYYGVRGRKTAVIRNPSSFMNGTGAIIKTGALLMASQMIGNPSPSAMKESGAPATGDEKLKETRGIMRVTRHPAFCAFGLWGLGNALQVATLPGMIFWAGFPTFYYIGSLHQDYRQKATLPKEYFDKTSVLPFAAIVQKRNSFSKFVEEINWQNASIAAGLGAARIGLRKMGRPFLFWKN